VLVVLELARVVVVELARLVEWRFARRPSPGDGRCSGVARRESRSERRTRNVRENGREGREETVSV
jgi:hypothetical protein